MTQTRITIICDEEGWNLLDHGRLVFSAPIAGDNSPAADIAWAELRAKVEGRISSARYAALAEVFDPAKLPAETVEQFLARGGQITKCPTGGRQRAIRADSTASNSMVDQLISEIAGLDLGI